MPHDSGTMRDRRIVAGERSALRRVLFQTALVAACHKPLLKSAAERLKDKRKPHKLVTMAIPRGWSP